MKTVNIQVERGRHYDVEDVGLSHCFCFSEHGDGRITGLVRDAAGHNAICIWKESGGAYKPTP